MSSPGVDENGRNGGTDMDVDFEAPGNVAVELRMDSLLSAVIEDRSQQVAGNVREMAQLDLQAAEIALKKEDMRRANRALLGENRKDSVLQLANHERIAWKATQAQESTTLAQRDMMSTSSRGTENKKSASTRTTGSTSSGAASVALDNTGRGLGASASSSSSSSSAASGATFASWMGGGENPFKGLFMSGPSEPAEEVSPFLGIPGWN